MTDSCEQTQMNTQPAIKSAPTNNRNLPGFARFARKVVAASWFHHAITVIILANAAVIGLDTHAPLANTYHDVFVLANRFFLSLFIVEALIKISAHWPRVSDYYRDGWNVFDFSIIVVCLLPFNSELATVARLVRLMRVLRLLSALPELRLIVSTLVRSIPGMFNVMALMSIIFYIYGVAGYHLFHDIDPTHWRNLGISLLSLFRIVTLEDWTDIMYAAMEAYWWAWMFFVSFVVVGTFVVINLFIAVVLNNLEAAKLEALDELRSPASKEELMKEITRTQDALAALHRRLEEDQR